jgi:hypothetical protein
MGVAMTWSSAYMQVLCGFLLLAAFHFFLRYNETGRRRYLYLQWIPFLTGFLVMETTIVYPAIAATYAWLCARRHFKKTLPLFVPSILFTILHMTLAPKQASGTSSIHVDLSMVHTLWTYWRWFFRTLRAGVSLDHAAEVDPLRQPRCCSPWPWWALRVGWRGAATACRCSSLPVSLSWWLRAPIARAHHQLLPDAAQYGSGLPGSRRRRLRVFRAGQKYWTRRAAAAVLAGFFLVVSVPKAHSVTRWWHDRARRVRNMTLGVVEARHCTPREVILLAGVDDTCSGAASWTAAFGAAGVFGSLPRTETEQRTVSRPALATSRDLSCPLRLYCADSRTTNS